jgi:hypothetical protein
VQGYDRAGSVELVHEAVARGLRPEEIAGLPRAVHELRGRTSPEDALKAIHATVRAGRRPPWAAGGPFSGNDGRPLPSMPDRPSAHPPGRP